MQQSGIKNVLFYSSACYWRDMEVILAKFMPQNMIYNVFRYVAYMTRDVVKIYFLQNFYAYYFWYHVFYLMFIAIG